MLQVDLSTLNGPELRRLLDDARARGQADLSFSILKEMEARRAAPQDPPRPMFGGARRTAPRFADLNLPGERRPGDEEDETPGPDLSSAPPLTLTPEDAPSPDVTADDGEPLEILWHEPTHPGPPPKRIRRIGFAAGIAVGVAAGVVLGLAVAEISFQSEPPAETPAMAALLSPAPPAKPALQVVARAEPLAPAVADPPQPEAAPAADAAGLPAAEVAAAEEAPEAPTVPVPHAARCAGLPTPADRAICGDPELQDLQRRLREAYANALDVHEDRGLLRQRQLAWRDSRSEVSDPEELARLYRQRIHRLDAASREAERQRR